MDNTRWRCSVCARHNDRKSPIDHCLSPPSLLVPQEFLFDPITKTYGDPRRRPEVRFGTVEYAATSDYMVSCTPTFDFTPSSSLGSTTTTGHVSLPPRRLAQCHSNRLPAIVL